MATSKKVVLKDLKGKSLEVDMGNTTLNVTSDGLWLASKNGKKLISMYLGDVGGANNVSIGIEEDAKSMNSQGYSAALSSLDGVGVLQLQDDNLEAQLLDGNDVKLLKQFLTEYKQVIEELEADDEVELTDDDEVQDTKQQEVGFWRKLLWGS